MKTKKVKLSELKVNSFVTEFNKEEENTVVGGLASIGKWCTFNPDCRDQQVLTKGAFCTTRL